MTLAPRRIVTVDLAGRVLGLQAEVVSVKQVDAELAVSYGGEYETAGPTTLALVAAGYGDGVPRAAKGAVVTIGTFSTPIRGRVAMDQVVLDIGDEPVAPGTLAVLWGEGGASAEEWATHGGFPAAMLSGCVSPRAEVVVSDQVADADAMEAFGQRLASVLRPGDVVILTGELGAGKTTLTRGIGAALGAQGTVQSPTFVIARTHRTATVPLLHVDAYRLGDAAELDDLDLDIENSITVAEWGLPLIDAVDSYLHVDIVRSRGDDDIRRIRVTSHGEAWAGQRLLALTEAP